MPTLQIVEDDESIAEVLRFNLEKAGYVVHLARNCDDALVDIGIYRPDLIILDWMLPDMSGIDLARLIRRDEKTNKTPIIMLTARSSEDDRVLGLEIGADDYVTKPFSMRELQSRIKAHLRKGEIDASLVFGDITIDFVRFKVMRGSREVRLSPREFEVLKLLSSRPGRVFSREQILDSVWGVDGDLEFRTVDVVIGRLRRALRRGREVDYIRTVRSIGYSWEPDAAVSNAATPGFRSLRA